MDKKKQAVLISACLLDLPCRYDGNSCGVAGLLEGIDSDRIVPVCPEQMGGLSTPREPACMRGGDGSFVLDGKARVLTLSGRDVTANFLAGAHMLLKISTMLGVETAVLKEKSPSCGVNLTTIDRETVQGKGVAAAALHRAGVTVIPDTTFIS